MDGLLQGNERIKISSKYQNLVKLFSTWDREGNIVFSKFFLLRQLGNSLEGSKCVHLRDRSLTK